MDKDRTVVVHDYFAIRGGGERLALTLAEALQATLVYGFREEDTYPQSMFGNVIDLHLPPLLRRPGIRALALARRFYHAQDIAAAYSTRIFSGAFAPFAAPARQVGGVNIFYCHSPPRFLFDQRRHFFGTLPWPARIMAPLVAGLFERRYRDAISRMDAIVVNSENTRSRLRRYLGLDSTVVYPPVETGRFVWRGQGDYYLSTARLSSLKRVDRIVDAFLRLPDKRLVVASGGKDLEVLNRRASGAKNIEFRGWVSEDELLELVGNAIATIYLPLDEDFGMSPVESMAAGKPVIGVAEGGLVETILPGRTGTLLAWDFSDADLIAAVNEMTPQRATCMRIACEEQARKFSRETFVGAILKIIHIAHTRVAPED